MKKLALLFALVLSFAAAGSAQFYTPKASKAEANKTLTERNGSGPAQQAAITEASNPCCIAKEACCNPPQECCFPKTGTKATTQQTNSQSNCCPSTENCTEPQNCAPESCTQPQNCPQQENCAQPQTCE